MKKNIAALLMLAFILTMISVTAIHAVAAEEAVQTYTVNYVVFGETETATKNKGEPLTIKDCSRSGYIFKGWALEKGGREVYDSGDVYSNDADTTFYAILGLACGNSGCSDGYLSTIPCTNKSCNGGKVSIVCPDCKGNGSITEKTNCVYCGADGKVGSDVWKECELCAVSYKPDCSRCNGYGSYLTQTQTTCTYCYGTGKWTVNTECPKTITVNCSTCGGDGRENRTSDCPDCVSSIKVNSYYIGYDANGGTGAPTSQRKSYGEDIILHSEVPKRAGYTFLGWSTTADGAVEYLPGEEFDKNDSFTLYAVWEEGGAIQPPVATGKLGDVNADGAIDQFDYILVKRHYFETRYLTDDELTRADVNSDGAIDQFDYILIKRHYFGTYTIESESSGNEPGLDEAVRTGVTLADLYLREAPSTVSAVIGRIPNGATVRIKGQSGGWYLVEFNGITGYASSDYIEVN